jgi:hypothetical protein
VRLTTEESGDGTLRVLVVNRADVPFGAVDLVIGYHELDAPGRHTGRILDFGVRNYFDAIEPHPGGRVLTSDPLDPERWWTWEITFSDSEGRRWRKRERDYYFADEVPVDDESEEFTFGVA